MIQQVFCYFDSKAEVYLQPFFAQAKGSAIRSFSDLVNDASSTFGKHPSDFVLFYIGEYNHQNAEFTPLTPTSLGVGNEFVNS